MRRIQESGIRSGFVSRWTRNRKRERLVMSFPRKAGSAGRSRPSGPTFGAPGPESRESDFRIVYGQASDRDDVIAIHTRSGMQILRPSSPPWWAFRRITCARGAPFPRRRHRRPARTPCRPSSAIASGSFRPDDAFAAVRYGGLWYWIENRGSQVQRGLHVPPDSVDAGGSRGEGAGTGAHHPGQLTGLFTSRRLLTRTSGATR